jgi:hypothetical protein
MFRERSEIISFSKDDLERLVRYMAQQQIVGHLFIGKFGEQEIRWRHDGGVDVITKYVQGGWEDIPKPEHQYGAQIAHLEQQPDESKPKRKK